MRGSRGEENPLVGENAPRLLASQSASALAMRGAAGLSMAACGEEIGSGPGPALVTRGGETAGLLAKSDADKKKVTVGLLRRRGKQQHG